MPSSFKFITPSNLSRLVGALARWLAAARAIGGLLSAVKGLAVLRLTMQAGMLVFVFVGFAPLAEAKGPADQGFRKLAGKQIHAAFAGKVFSDGIHFRNRYKANGTIEGVSMGKKISNKWKIGKDTLCITDSMDELCYAVWMKGKDVQLVYENSDVTLEGSIE